MPPRIARSVLAIGRLGAGLALLGLLACEREVLVGYAGTDAATRSHPPVTWPSGSHPGSELQDYLDWGTWRGHPNEVAHVYTDRRSWRGLVQPGWPLDEFAPFTGTLVMSQPLFPEGAQGNLTDCAAGAYDAEWEQLGSYLIEKDRADIVLRIGWGPNDPVKEWRSGEEPSEWIACFRRVVSAIRSTDPDVRIDFTVNSYASAYPSGGDPFAAYPGDDHVDIVGMDVYDLDPPARTEAEWNARCDQPFGLCRMFEFARAHGKLAAVGEWGVASCGQSPGGDNPLFVQKMFETFSENDDVLAYEAYFDDVAAGVCSTLADDGPNPRASARYRELY